ncbi:MAG: hypothetical protein H6747_06990 [Deltaproteobacteria bacterium]|nr:hypothetical protein [Deltaproteobacteria bacterium]
MLSRISFRLLIVGLALATALTGCGDDEPVGQVKSDAAGADTDTGADAGGDIGGVDATPSATLTFSVEHKKGPSLVDPINAAIFDLSMDKYDTLEDAGFQLDVIVTGKNVPDGTEVEVLVGGASGGKATMTGGSARIDKVTMPCSAVQLNLGVRATVSGADVVSNKSVLLNCGNACNAALVPVTGCLSEDADTAKAGFQAAFTVTTATTDCTHAYLTVTDTAGKVSDTEKVALSGGKATIVATIASSDTGLNGAKASVVAVVEDQAHSDRPEGKSAAQDVTVTTDKPEVAFVSPAKETLTLADDANGDASDGVQVTLVGTATTLTASDIGAIKVYVDGAEVATTSLKLNGSFDVDLSFAASKTYAVKVTATNGCGLVGEVEKSFTVIANKANLTITSPATGSVLLAKDDVNTATTLTYDTSFSVALQDALDGASIGIYCRKNEAGSAYGVAAVGKAQVVGGAGVVEVPVSIVTGVYGTSVVCIARDDAQNPAESLPVAVTLAIPPPCMTIQLPADGFVTAAASLAVGATATGLDGAVVEAKVQLVGGATFIDTPVSKIANGSFTASVALQVGSPPVVLPDGTYTLTLGASDAFGNDVADGSCSSLTRTFSLDRTPPKLALALPTKTVLDPLVDPDTNDVALGYQTKVTYSLSGEPATATSKVCLVVNSFPLPCQTIVGNGQVAFGSVPLQPGSNAIVATATDSLGNKSNPVTTNITLQSNAVVVGWTEPLAGTVVATNSVKVQVKVTGQKTSAPVLGATGLLILNGAEMPAVAFSEVGGGVYEATVTDLQPGANILQVVMTPSTGADEGVSPQLSVVYKTSKPTVAFSALKDGEVVNLASGKCVAGLKDCISNIGITTTSVSDGVEAKLEIVCGLPGSSTVTTVATVAGGTASFVSQTLPHGTSCTLRATVTDEAGQQATPAVAKITIDRVAPVLYGIVPPKTSFLALDDIDGNAANGVQANLVFSFDGVPSSSPLTLSVYKGDTQISNKTISNHVGAAEGTKKSVNLGTVSMPDGSDIKLQVTASDAAGNTTTWTQIFSVVASAPEVRISGPGAGTLGSCKSNSDCAASEFCYLSKCTVPWPKLAVRSLSVAVLGVLPGSTLRVCSNSPTATGAACAKAGTKQLGESQTLQAYSAVVDLKSAPDALHEVHAELLPTGLDAAVAANWVLSDTSNIATTRSRRLLIDSIAPTLKSVLPPTAAGVPATCLAKASQSKLDGGAPGGSFSFAATTTGEDARIDIVTGGSVVGTASTTNNVAGVSIKLTKEGSTSLVAIATDAVGNEAAPVVVGTYDVNTIVPIGAFTAPSKATLNGADGLDIAISSADVDTEGAPVILKDGGTTIGSVAMASGTASFTHALYGTLTDGEHTLTATISDTCANTSIVATIPAKISVDTVAPTASIANPTDLQAFGDADDASVASGYQVAVTFGTSGASTWGLTLGVECDDTFANCASFNPVSTGTVTNDGANEPTVSVTIPFGTSANYVLRLVATDAVGNKTTIDRKFKVSLTGCLVTVKGLPADGKLNTAACATPGSDCASVTANVTAEYLGPCGAVDALKFYVGGSEVASKSPVDAKASADIVIADGVDTSVEVKAYAGTTEGGASGPISLQADLKNPTVAFVAGTVAGKSTPAGGSTVAVAKAADLDVGKNGHQLHLLLSTTDSGLSGGALVSLEEVSGTATNATSSLTLPLVFGANGTVATEIKFLDLAQDKTSTIRATVKDAAGNTATADITIQVDWTPPAAITLADFGDGDINPRRPFAKLSFKAVADNGNAGTAAAKYEVVYSTSEITDATTFGSACAVTSLAATKVPSPAAPGADESIIVEGPDPRADSDSCKFGPLSDNGKSKYFFAVRAIDAAGNVGAISNVVSTDAIRLRYAKISSSVAPWNSAALYQRAGGIGDVNGDGLGDVKIGAASGGKFCVIYGHANSDSTVSDLDIQAKSASTHTCFDNTLAMGREFITGIDVNGDGIQDLVVSVGEGTNVDREVQIFLGQQGKAISTTPDVTITGIYSNLTQGIRALASAGNFNGDVSGSGKAVEDIVLWVPSKGDEPDRVYVIPGNASWTVGANKTINITVEGDRAANNVLRITRTDSVGSPGFGRMAASVGNMLTDGDGTGQQYEDLAISQFSGLTQIYVLKGRPWTGAADLTLTGDLDGAGNADATAVVVRPHNTGPDNFSSPIRVDFDGDAVPDLAAMHAPSSGANWLYWCSGKVIAQNLGKVLTLNQSQVPGDTTLLSNVAGYASEVWASPIVPVGDFFDQGDGTIAIMGGRPFNAPGGRTAMVFRAAQKRSTSPTPDIPSYNVDDVFMTHPFVAGAATLGAFSFSGVGDFNGDGLPDAIVSTQSEGYAILIY